MQDVRLEAEGSSPDAIQEATDATSAERLVAQIMQVQRDFGHELRNVKSERHDRIRELIEKIAREAEAPK